MTTCGVGQQVVSEGIVEASVRQTLVVNIVSPETGRKCKSLSLYECMTVHGYCLCVCLDVYGCDAEIMLWFWKIWTRPNCLVRRRCSIQRFSRSFHPLSFVWSHCLARSYWKNTFTYTPLHTCHNSHIKTHLFLNHCCFTFLKVHHITLTNLLVHLPVQYTNLYQWDYQSQTRSAFRSSITLFVQLRLISLWGGFTNPNLTQCFYIFMLDVFTSSHISSTHPPKEHPCNATLNPGTKLTERMKLIFWIPST